jgi:hypothetical protein
VISSRSSTTARFSRDGRRAASANFAQSRSSSQTCRALVPARSVDRPGRLAASCWCRTRACSRITAGNIDISRPFASTTASHADTTTSEGTAVPRSIAPRCCTEYPTSRPSCPRVSPRSVRSRLSSAPSAAVAELAGSVIFGGRPGRRFPPPCGAPSFDSSSTAHPLVQRGLIC